MSAALLIDSPGLVTSVGLSTAESAAAIRAGLSNAQLTRFMDWGGEWMAAHTVPIDATSQRAKLLRMATLAVEECAGAQSQPAATERSALLLCLAEPSRADLGVTMGDTAIAEIADALQRRFSTHSATIAAGRVSGLYALQHARALLDEGKVDSAIVIGVDSYVNWPTLNHYENRHRLLTSRNSNGFIAGEAAAAVRVSRRTDAPAALLCDGIGFADETATVEADAPLRADGLVTAIRAAAQDAQCAADDFELRISALSGEHYFFKEAALAATRLIREASGNELWHPADCVGETGAAAAPLALAIAANACAKGFAPAGRMLCHVSGDGPERGAAFLRQGALT